ncbi:MAG: hypothetical protein WAT78_08960 [Rhizobiaceae bacterium]
MAKFRNTMTCERAARDRRGGGVPFSGWSASDGVLTVTGRAGSVRVPKTGGFSDCSVIAFPGFGWRYRLALARAY